MQLACSTTPRAFVPDPHVVSWSRSISAYVSQNIRGFVPRKKQAWLFSEIDRRIAANVKHIEVVAVCCHTFGKTATAALVHNWGMEMHPGARGVTIAQKWAAINDNLWPYIRTFHRNSILGSNGYGKVFKEPRMEFDENWFSTGVASDQPGNVEGHHAAPIEWSGSLGKGTGSFAIRVIDEAKSVPVEMRRATQPFLHAERSLDMAISTPWVADGWLYDLWQRSEDDPRIIRVHATLRDLIEEGVPEAQAAWDDFLVEYGSEYHPEFRARALAEFMPADPYSCVDLASLEACMHRTPSTSGARVVGVDVARSTDGDATVITRAIGRDVVAPQTTLKVRDTVMVARRAVAEARDFGADLIRVDAVGVGGGVVDAIKAEGWAKVEEFLASSEANNPERFADRMTEAAWEYAERIRNKSVTIPNSSDFKKGALQVRFIPIKGGRWRLDKAPKGAASPDHWDSACMATLAPVTSWADALKRVAERRRADS